MKSGRLRLLYPTANRNQEFRLASCRRRQGPYGKLRSGRCDTPDHRPTLLLGSMSSWRVQFSTVGSVSIRPQRLVGGCLIPYPWLRHWPYTVGYPSRNTEWKNGVYVCSWTPLDRAPVSMRHFRRRQAPPPIFGGTAAHRHMYSLAVKDQRRYVTINGIATVHIKVTGSYTCNKVLSYTEGERRRRGRDLRVLPP